MEQEQDLYAVINNLQAKTEKLITLHRQLGTDYSKLVTEKQDLVKRIEDQDKTIADLEEKNKVLKLAKVVAETDEKKNTELKYKINELVREIDSCVAILNK